MNIDHYQNIAENPIHWLAICAIFEGIRYFRIKTAAKVALQLTSRSQTRERIEIFRLALGGSILGRRLGRKREKADTSSVIK
jgi:hypothetical protein